MRYRITYRAILSCLAFGISGCENSPTDPSSSPGVTEVEPLGPDPVTLHHENGGFFDPAGRFFHGVADVQMDVADVADQASKELENRNHPVAAGIVEVVADLKRATANIADALGGIVDFIGNLFDSESIPNPSSFAVVSAQSASLVEPTHATEPASPIRALIRREIEFNERVLSIDCLNVVEDVIPIRDEGFLARCERAQIVATRSLTKLVGLSEKVETLNPETMAALDDVIPMPLVDQVQDILQPLADPEGDGIPNILDACPGRDQAQLEGQDSDGDGIVDQCDPLPDVPS